MPKRHKIRIIGGEYRSRMINIIDAEGLRPTSSRMRETLFNWLQPITPSATCIDLFAGSGALGIEALSRGAKKCYFIEKDRAVFQQLKKNIESLDIEPTRYELICTDSILWLRNQSNHPNISPNNNNQLIFFIDPPFNQTPLYESTIKLLIQSTVALQNSHLIIEMPIKSRLESQTALSYQYHLQKEMKTKESLIQYYASN